MFVVVSSPLIPSQFIQLTLIHPIVYINLTIWYNHIQSQFTQLACKLQLLLTLTALTMTSNSGGSVSAPNLLEDCGTRMVGPYVLGKTLGKGQTGNFHLIYSLFWDLISASQ